jgi:hypothetical protein
MSLQVGLIRVREWIAISIGLLAATCTRADALLDFTLFNPPPSEQRKIAEPVMTWLVQADPKAYCEKASPKDGMFIRPEGCVYWQVRSSSCTIVTTNSTTHSQLGHLFLHCLQAQ